MTGSFFVQIKKMSLDEEYRHHTDRKKRNKCESFVVAAIFRFVIDQREDHADEKTKHHARKTS